MSSLASNLYEFDEFRLDPQSRVFRRAGTTVPITPKAFDVLRLVVIRSPLCVAITPQREAGWRNGLLPIVSTSSPSLQRLCPQSAIIDVDVFDVDVFPQSGDHLECCRFIFERY
jgi:hypothetical protein